VLFLDGERDWFAVYREHFGDRYVRRQAVDAAYGTLAPTEFRQFRDHLGQASGLQSYMYRMVEYALGNKLAALAHPYRDVSDVHREVCAALHAPSVYDAALRLLARR